LHLWQLYITLSNSHLPCCLPLLQQSLAHSSFSPQKSSLYLFYDFLAIFSGYVSRYRISTLCKTWSSTSLVAACQDTGTAGCRHKFVFTAVSYIVAGIDCYSNDDAFLTGNRGACIMSATYGVIWPISLVR
jgi:hypothetical protein